MAIILIRDQQTTTHSCTEGFDTATCNETWSHPRPQNARSQRLGSIFGHEGTSPISQNFRVVGCLIQYSKHICTGYDLSEVSDAVRGGDIEIWGDIRRPHQSNVIEMMSFQVSRRYAWPADSARTYCSATPRKEFYLCPIVEVGGSQHSQIKTIEMFVPLQAT